MSNIFNFWGEKMIGTGELILILCAVLILFGGKKLPEFAKSLGKGIREFKRACQGLDETEEASTTAPLVKVDRIENDEPK